MVTDNTREFFGTWLSDYLDNYIDGKKWRKKEIDNTYNDCVLLAVTGSFLMLSLSPFSFLERLAAYVQPKKPSMKNRIEKSWKNRQPRGIKLLFPETKETLRLTGKSGMLMMLCILAMLLFVLGVMIALTMKNGFLVSVLAVGFALLPFYYVKFTAGRHKKQINTELETALSIITTSYLRGKNAIIRAIEENTPYLNQSLPRCSETFCCRPNSSTPI